ncbi:MULTISPECIES: trypco2 family protein [Streptomyces]|uniref:Trypsin-co-occurring domain-containing protein n=1 Tax=Streptomyces spororaveus TaxID=284039 RepID=A0ABQ3T3F6_9ACTN|nr:trypco2 family protein [Streptomyces spororaveus]MCM9077195.1 hypothetical protein [Streptomyces spororaveus]GHI74926.1 hypothetical protein Sspor_04870 [Streptomyces spororaveus]
MTDMREENQTSDLGLADMVSGLRRELEVAQQRALAEELKFSVEDVEIEASVQVTKSGGGKAGVQFWVVQAGGEFARSNASTHRIKLNLRLPETTHIGDSNKDPK